MSAFLKNPTHFAADCACRDGKCEILRELFLFLDDANEIAAVSQLQTKCGSVVIIPDTSSKGRALLYHTSCQRMTDVVQQIFEQHLEEPASLPRAAAEMTIGELYRRGVAISYDHCRARVASFDFAGAAPE
jgi:hypothetical protein